MRLAQVKVQKKNVLSSAIHNLYGLVWTTGTAILLTDIAEIDSEGFSSSVGEDCDQRKSTVTLGEFSNVEDVCWSDFDSCTPLLSAIHKETDEAQPTLEVWEFVQSKPSLELRSILKQHLPHSPSNYGCMVWNSCSSKLCVVLRGSAHVYCAEQITRFFRPVFAKFTCGVWSQDSSQLLLSTDTALVLYSANNLETQLLEMICVVKVPGIIAAIAPSPNLYLCTRELPLHDLIQKSSSDVLPSYLRVTDSAPQLFGEVIPTASTASSCIVMVSTQGIVLATMGLEGMLTPNLLSWCAARCWCVVGSSMARSFQVVSVCGDIMEKQHRISIPTNKRAKGISITKGDSDNMFMAVADVFPGDNQLFPQSLRETTWLLTISSLDIATATDSSPCNSPSRDDYLPLGMDVGIGKLTIPSRPTDSKKASGDFRLPAGGFATPVSETSRSSFSVVDPIIHKLTENLKQQLQVQEGKSQSVKSQNVTSISRYPRQKKQPIENRQVVPVERRSYSTCVKNPYKIQEVADHRVDVYESMKDIATVDVVCIYTDAQGSKVSERMKRFLLTTGGLLSVDMLKRVFEVEEIEIRTGSTYAAFCPTEDGYVPIKFKTGEKFMIRGIIHHL